MTHRLRLPGLAAALACALALPLGSAPPASAASTRHDGVTLFTDVTNCDSVILGYPYQEPGAAVVAGAVYDDQAPPVVGDVFYAVVEFAAVGNPYPCLDQSIRPDMVLPAGVSLAISAANPIRCTKWDYTSSTPTQTPETALCPTGPQPAESGGSVSFGNRAGDMWKVPTGIGYEIRIPVRVSAPADVIFTFPTRIVDGNANPVLRAVATPLEIGAGGTGPTDPIDPDPTDPDPTNPDPTDPTPTDPTPTDPTPTDPDPGEPTDPDPGDPGDPTGRIFFQSNRDGNPQIYSMNPDGSGIARLTTSGGNLSPAVSPGGTRVAYVHAGDVWTMDVDGGDRQQVTQTPSVEESPTWSPDGTRIAYVSRTSPDGGNDQEIWVRPADGTGPAVQITANTVPDVAPSWSPVLDGAPDGLIAFVTTRSGDRDRNVYVMDPTGGAVRNLTPPRDYGGLPYQGHDDHPSWSRDGRVAYTHTFQPNASGLPAVWQVGADGTGMSRVSLDPTQSASEPAWSPEATHLVYVGTTGTDRNIAVMASDGGQAAHLDLATSHDVAPDWGQVTADPTDPTDPTVPTDPTDPGIPGIPDEPAPEYTANLATTVPGTVRLDRHRGRVPVRMSAGPVDSQVVVTILARVRGTWTQVARTTHAVSSSDRATLLVPIRRTWRRALDDRTVKAKVVTVLTPPAEQSLRRLVRFRMIG